MSFEAAAWAMKQRPKTAAEKLCLVAIADCIHSEMDYCWPSVDHLSDMILCSKRNTQYVLKSLEEQGFESVEKIAGRSSRYRLLRGANSAPLKPIAQGGAISCTGGRNDIPSNPPKSKVQPSNKEGINKEKGICTFELIWNQYPRKESKARAQTAFLNLKKSEQQELVDHLPLRIKNQYSTMDKQFIPYLSTFINQRRWRDDPTTFSQKANIRLMTDNQLLKLAQEKNLSTHGLSREILIQKIERVA